MKSMVKSKGRMSNRQYHLHGKPWWWVRMGDVFLKIPGIRGDYPLVAQVDVPPGTKLQIGVGPRDGKGIRETVITSENVEGETRKEDQE